MSDALTCHKSDLLADPLVYVRSVASVQRTPISPALPNDPMGD